MAVSADTAQLLLGMLDTASIPLRDPLLVEKAAAFAKARDELLHVLAAAAPQPSDAEQAPDA